MHISACHHLVCCELLSCHICISRFFLDRGFEACVLSVSFLSLFLALSISLVPSLSSPRSRSQSLCATQKNTDAQEKIIRPRAASSEKRKVEKKDQ